MGRFILLIILAFGAWFFFIKDKSISHQIPYYINTWAIRLENNITDIVSFGKTETEKAMENPQALTPAQKRMFSSWGEGEKIIYVNKAVSLRNRVEERMQGGYFYNRDSAHRALRDISILETAIRKDDCLVVSKLYDTAENSVHFFEAGCRWQAGMKHLKYSHIRSSVYEGRWEPEQGWGFLHPDDPTSYDVGRICQICNGNGIAQVETTCPDCNGQGVRETVLSVGAKFVNMYERHRGRGSIVPDGPVTCSRCNRRGSILQPQQCPKCGGTGVVSDYW